MSSPVAQRFTAVAFADELLAHPELLRAYAGQFAAGEPATLVVYGPGRAPHELEALLQPALAAAGAIGSQVRPLALTPGLATECELAGQADCLLSRDDPGGPLGALRRVDDTSAPLLRELAGRRWRAATAALSLACEIHVPISPTPPFLRSVRYLAASLRRFGGALADSPIVVTVSLDGAPEEIGRALRWADDFPIVWRWLDPAVWVAQHHYGTALQRFREEPATPLMLLLDADVVLVAPIDDLLARVIELDGIAGVPAYVSPTAATHLWRERGEGGPDGTVWNRLFAHAGLAEPVLTCEHPGFGVLDHDPERRRCPPYFNFGMLAATGGAVRRLGGVVFEEQARVEAFADTVYRCQLALTLALARTGTPSLAVSPRYNLPNLQPLWDSYPEEAADLRVLHYLGQDGFHKWDDLATDASVRGFLARRGLAPANERLRDILAELEEGTAA